jgi:hypothetical protein
LDPTIDLLHTPLGCPLSSFAFTTTLLLHRRCNLSGLNNNKSKQEEMSLNKE